MSFPFWFPPQSALQWCISVSSAGLEESAPGHKPQSKGNHDDAPCPRLEIAAPYQTLIYISQQSNISEGYSVPSSDLKQGWGRWGDVQKLLKQLYLSAVIPEFVASRQANRRCRHPRSEFKSRGLIGKRKERSSLSCRQIRAAKWFFRFLWKHTGFYRRA